VLFAEVSILLVQNAAGPTDLGLTGVLIREFPHLTAEFKIISVLFFTVSSLGTLVSTLKLTQFRSSHVEKRALASPVEGLYGFLNHATALSSALLLVVR